MPDTQTDQPAPQPLRVILHRVAQPLLLFAGVLFGLLLLSYLLLLPRYTRLHNADGTALSPRAIARYERALAADLAAREEERIRLVLPVHDAAFTALKERKDAHLFLDVREQLTLAAARLGEAEDSVVFTRIVFEGDAVMLEGDVRNVGTRSMTVLAAYVEELARLPFVADLERPRFTREEREDGTMHSPFTMRFRLVRP